MQHARSASGRPPSDTLVMRLPDVPRVEMTPAARSWDDDRSAGSFASGSVGHDADAGTWSPASPGAAAESPAFPAGPNGGAYLRTEGWPPPGEEGTPPQDVDQLPGGDQPSMPPLALSTSEPAGRETSGIVTASPDGVDRREGTTDPASSAHGAGMPQIPAEAPHAEAASDEAPSPVPAIDEPQSDLSPVDLSHAGEPQSDERGISPTPGSARSAEGKGQSNQPSDEGDVQISPLSPQTRPVLLPECMIGAEKAQRAGSSGAVADITRTAQARRLPQIARERLRAQGPRRRPSTARTAFDRPPPRLTDRFILPDSYRRWDRALAEYCLLEQSGRPGPAYLGITPRVLSAALETQEGVLLSPEEAAKEFIGAVSLAYRTHVLNEPERLWALAAPEGDGTPSSVGLLGLSVLAAYEMHSDEEAGPNAYYPRLASLLGCDLVAGLPRGFVPEDFGHLWDLLSHWLEVRTGRSLALPGPEVGFRRFVAYPLCHVPLRKVDIEKLPEFFDSAGLEPGSKVDPALLGEDFERWADGRGILSKAGEAAMADNRRPAVEAQISVELEAWDGSWTDRFGSRIGAVHILLDFVQRRPELYFLPRRPTGFPASFDEGPHFFEAGEQGWYDQTEILAEDGPILEDGFRWTWRGPQGTFSLHRPSSTAIALCPTAEFTGYLSQQGLPLGAQSSVLCTVTRKDAAEEFLSAVASVHCRPLEHPGLPEGWCLFTGIIPRQALPTPPGLGALAIETNTTVILRGGLRLGRRASWMTGAPPTILITGPDGIAASLDGESAEVTNGVITLKGPLRPGPHVVEVGGACRRFEVVQPEGRWDAFPSLVPQETSAVRVPVALPPGLWAVLGATPGDVARAGPSDRGSLLTVGFTPVWAVSVGWGRGAIVLSLCDTLPRPNLGFLGVARPSASASAWVSAIYEAEIRRPRFGSLNGIPNNSALLAAWRTYVQVARKMKRRWRRLP
jgi:hypothetical protein